MAPFTRGRALVIGVGSHNNPRWDVPTATRDARDIHQTLVESAGYDPGNAELLTDSQATRIGVLDAFKRLANRCNEESVALISLTCHGVAGANGLFTFATSDARFTAQHSIEAGTGLTVTDLARAIKDVPAGKLLLIVNACMAGHVGRVLNNFDVAPEFADRAPGAPLTDAAGNEILETGDGRAIITAGRPDQLSYFQKDEQHSYFGQALIDALRGSAVSTASGVVGLYELYEEVYLKVRDVTRRRLGVAQEPVLTVLQNTGPFPVATSQAVGGSTEISQRPAPDLPVREVPKNVVTASGAGSTAFVAEAGSTVHVDNSKLIDFGGATVMGGVRIGDVAGGDMIKIGTSDSQPPEDDQLDPLLVLPIQIKRVEVARNVDEDERDNAVNLLRQSLRALHQQEHDKAVARIDSALVILRAMNNGYINSVVRKLETLKQAL